MLYFAGISWHISIKQSCKGLFVSLPRAYVDAGKLDPNCNYFYSTLTTVASSN